MSVDATVTLSRVAECARHQLLLRCSPAKKVHVDALDVGNRHVENTDPHCAGDCYDCQDNDGVRVRHERLGDRDGDHGVGDDPVCGPDCEKT